MMTATPSDRSLPQDHEASDAALVVAIAIGDRVALATAWDRYRSRTRTVLRAIIGPDEDVEDLLQDVFIALWQRAGAIRDGAALKAFLTQTAVRRSLAELRRRRIRRWIGLSPWGNLPDVAGPPMDLESRAALRAFYRVLTMVPTRARVAYVLHAVEGLEVMEVASALGVSRATAVRAIRQGRQRVLTAALRDPALHRWAVASGGGETS